MNILKILGIAASLLAVSIWYFSGEPIGEIRILWQVTIIVSVATLTRLVIPLSLRTVREVNFLEPRKNNHIFLDSLQLILVFGGSGLIGAFWIYMAAELISSWFRPFSDVGWLLVVAIGLIWFVVCQWYDIEKSDRPNSFRLRD